MDQTTFFPFRCPNCDGRARVASKHAGQLIVCPHCQANAAAVPDPRPLTQPGRIDGQGNPITTSRIARPFDPTTSASFRRPRVDEHFPGESGALGGGPAGDPTSSGPNSRTAGGTARISSGARPAVTPGTSALRRTSVTLSQAASAAQANVNAQQAAAAQPGGQPAGQPGTASINRTTAMRQLPAPLPPPRPSQLPFVCAGVSALLFAAVAGWALYDGSTYRTRWQMATQQAEDAEVAQAKAQAAAADGERRMAQLQTELAAAKAATARERDVVSELQKTNGRLADELVRASQIQAPTLSAGPATGATDRTLAGGTFPAPTAPAAGVPAARRDGDAELK